ncbi:MAG: 6-carboxytetrahydropterin synthase QueD [Gammaproteobacteria bacterium]|nr:MAG: 6-carboxytetrahydropterin synthase QueD [Gammaproteobacteria bacterium]
MASKYILKVATEFSSAHTLRDYPGPCNRFHGHNWKVEVEVEASELDEAGMGLDFKDIRKAAKDAAATLDHRYLNDVPPFDKQNPTAENIAAHLFRGVADALNDDRVRVRSVTLWETERACARYSEE